MKRGMATWYREHVGDSGKHLAVFLGTDMKGFPVIQTDDEQKPFSTTWAHLSQVLSDDVDDRDP